MNQQLLACPMVGALRGSVMASDHPCQLDKRDPLLGAAGVRQVPGARFGVQHNLGMGGAAVVYEAPAGLWG